MKLFTLLLIHFTLILTLSAKTNGSVLNENAKLIRRHPIENDLSCSNVIKIDPFKMAFGGLNLSYEHFISDNRSFNIRAKYNSLRFIEDYMKNSSIISESYSGIFDDIKLSHWGLDTDYRFYVLQRKPHQGIYLGTYLHYGNYKANYEPIMNTEINGVATDVNLISKPTVNLVGGGFEAGMQWLIHNRFSIDWKIFAVGGNVSMLDMHYASDNLDAVVDPIDPNIANKPVLIPMFLSLYYFHSNAHYTQLNVLPFLHSNFSVGFTF